MNNLPSGCKNMEEFSRYIHGRIEACMKDRKSKEETMKHLLDHYQIKHEMTSLVWDLCEEKYPDYFRYYHQSCENYREIGEVSRIDWESHIFIPRWGRDRREKDDRNIQRDDFKSVEEESYYVHGWIMECMRKYKSKEETVKHLLDQYRITPESTNRVWDRLEQDYQANFRSYYKACEKYRKIREQEAPRTGEEVATNAQTIAETRSSSTAVASKTLKLRGLKDVKVTKLEKQRTCTPDQSLMESGPSSQVPRLGPDAQPNGLMDMNVERDGKLIRRK